MLTDTAIRKAKPAEKIYRLFDMQGLYLEVSPRGYKYWRLKYYFLQKEKRIALGIYPTTTLLEAREKRDQARKLLAAGVDPGFVKKEEKRLALLNAATTFESIAREWHNNQINVWTAQYAQYVLNRIERDLFPMLGQMPIADIQPPHIVAAMRKIEKRGAHEIAHRLMQNCGQIFRYAIMTGRIERNPVSDLRGALQPVKHGHFAAMEVEDLPEFLKSLERNEGRLFPHTRIAMKLMLLTFVRTSELIEAKWDEINMEDRQWIIPAERMKMRRPHLVPLSSQALGLLKELKIIGGNREYIFPSQIEPRRHMSNNTILKALERMGYKGKMTGHGFRALAMSTIKEKLGYRHEVVDRQLAHAPKNKVDAAYDRAKFLDDRRKMMQEWADYIDSVSPQPLDQINEEGQ